MVPALATTVDPDVAQYGLGKTHGYTQSGPTTVTASSYSFNAFVDATTNGVINAAKVYGPLTGYFNTHGPQDLTVHTGGAEFEAKGYLSQTTLDGDFPNDNSGNYKLKIDSGTAGGSLSGYDYEVMFNLGGDSYASTVPMFTLNNGSWSNGTYIVASSGNQTMFGWTFSDYNSSTDVVLFSIRPTNGGDDVIRKQFQGSNPGGFTLDANSLTAGVDYTVELTYARIVYTDNTSISGAQGVGYYAMQTTFSLQAVPEPSTYALMALGLAAVLGWTWRRRAISSRG